MSVAFSMESRNLLLTSMAGWTYAVGTLGKRRAKILVNAAIAELILARGNLPVSQELSAVGGISHRQRIRSASR